MSHEEDPSLTPPTGDTDVFRRMEPGPGQPSGPRPEASLRGGPPPSQSGGSSTPTPSRPRRASTSELPNPNHGGHFVWEESSPDTDPDAGPTRVPGIPAFGVDVRGARSFAQHLGPRSAAPSAPRLSASTHARRQIPEPPAPYWSTSTPAAGGGWPGLAGRGLRRGDPQADRNGPPYPHQPPAGADFAHGTAGAPSFPAYAYNSQASHGNFHPAGRGDFSWTAGGNEYEESGQQRPPLASDPREPHAPLHSQGRQEQRGFPVNPQEHQERQQRWPAADSRVAGAALSSHDGAFDGQGQGQGGRDGSRGPGYGDTLDGFDRGTLAASTIRGHPASLSEQSTFANEPPVPALHDQIDAAINAQLAPLYAMMTQQFNALNARFSDDAPTAAATRMPSGPRPAPAAPTEAPSASDIRFARATNALQNPAPQAQQLPRTASFPTPGNGTTGTNNGNTHRIHFDDRDFPPSERTRRPSGRYSEAPARQSTNFANATFEESLANPDTLSFKDRVALLPKIAEYPVLSGNGDNWFDFIDQMDVFISAHAIPDTVVLPKLISCFTDNAKSWFHRRLREADAPTSWEEWKYEIRERFATPTWLHDQQNKLNAMEYSGQEPIAWLEEFLQGMRATQPYASLEDIKRTIVSRVSKRMAFLIRATPTARNAPMSSFMAIFEGIADTEYPNCRGRSTAPRASKDSRQVSFAAREPRSDSRPGRSSFSSQTRATSPAPDRSQPYAQPSTPDRGPRGCWGCGSPNHISNSRECPKANPATARSSAGPKVQALENNEDEAADEEIGSPDEDEVASWDGVTQAIELDEDDLKSDESYSFSDNEETSALDDFSDPLDFVIQALELSQNDGPDFVSRTTRYDETGDWSDDFYEVSDTEASPFDNMPTLEQVSALNSPTSISAHLTELSHEVTMENEDRADSTSSSSFHSSQMEYEVFEYPSVRRNPFERRRGHTAQGVIEARRRILHERFGTVELGPPAGQELEDIWDSHGQDYLWMEGIDSSEPLPPASFPEYASSDGDSDGSWGVDPLFPERPREPSPEPLENFGKNFLRLEQSARLEASPLYTLNVLNGYWQLPLNAAAHRPAADNIRERWTYQVHSTMRAFGMANSHRRYHFVDDAVLLSRWQFETHQAEMDRLFNANNPFGEDPRNWQLIRYEAPRPIVVAPPPQQALPALPRPMQSDSYQRLVQWFVARSMPPAARMRPNSFPWNDYSPSCDASDVAIFEGMPAFDEDEVSTIWVDTGDLFSARRNDPVLPFHQRMEFPLPRSTQELRTLFLEMRISAVPYDLFEENEHGLLTIGEEVEQLLNEEYARYSRLLHLTDIRHLNRGLWRRFIQRWLHSHRDMLPLDEADPELRTIYLGLLKSNRRPLVDEPIETSFCDSDSDFDDYDLQVAPLEVGFKVSTLEPPSGFAASRQLAEAGAPVLLSASEAKACFDSQPSRDAAMNAKRLQKGMAYKGGSAVVTRVILQGQPIIATLDTGAAPTVIGAGTLKRFDPESASKLMPLKGITRSFTAFNSKLNAIGIYDTPITFPHPSGNIRISVELVVIESSATHDWFIIGCDWLSPYGFNIMFGHSPSFTIGTLKQRFAIVPRSKQLVSYEDWAAAVAAPTEERDESTTTNFTSEVAALSAKEGSVSPEPEAFEAALKTMNINPDLSDEQRHELEAVIRRHPMAFAHGSHQLGYVSSHLCRVEFNPDAKPVNLRSGAFPQSPRARADLRKCLDDFLALGIIQPSKSKYAAPAFIVYQNEKPWMVVNFKNLNTVVAGDAYPLPRIDTTLFSLKDSEFLTSLDANKGFYQISVHPDHQERLAFICNFGLFEFLRMPMGFKNSPATFQRGMDQHFHEAIREGWFTVYVDDLLLKAKTWAEHMRNLEVTLRTLELNGWTMNPAKCFFAFKQVRQLGHRVSGLLLGIDENKIAAVRDLKIPVNRKELHSWIGFTGYFRKFIMDFAKIAKPLTNLLKQDTVWNWTDECTKAHDEIKRRLLSAPLLGQPDFAKPFRLYVDASADGLGAVLQQVQTINDKPLEVVICFISRQLRGAENRYGATQLEALGLVWALDKLYVFLDGCTFEVITDCIAIRSLLDMKTPNRHMLRWQLAIQEYRGRMTILHREGRIHQNADGMSRMALPNDASNPAADLSGEPEAVVHALSFVELNDEFFATIKASYVNDDNIRRIYSILTTPEADPSPHAGLTGDLRTQFDAGRFFLLDELLYRRKGASVALVICDQETRGAVLSACHDQVTAGHLGLEKTYARLRPLAWWPGAYTDTLEYVKSCDACQRANKHTGKPYGLAQRIEEPKTPWEILNMDFVTGFPPAGREGYNAVLVVVDRFSRRARFLPTFVDADAKFTALLFYKSIMSEHGVPAGIISDGDKLFTSDFWKHLAALCGFKLKLSTSYHPQTDGLAERFIGSLEDMLRRFVSFGPTWVDELGFTQDWCELLPGLEFALNSSVHSGLQREPFVVERGYIPRSIYSLITDRLPGVSANPSSESFAKMLASTHSRALECIASSVDAAKARWDAHHAEPPFNVGDTVMISTKHFTFTGPSKLIPPYVGPFAVLQSVGPNAIKVALTPPYDRKHPVFPVSLAKLHIPGDPTKFPGRRQAPAPQPDLIDGTPEWVIEKILDQRRRPPRGRKQASAIEYEVKWEGYDESYNRWLTEDKLFNAKEKLHEYRESRRASGDAVPAEQRERPRKPAPKRAPAPARRDTSPSLRGGGVSGQPEAQPEAHRPRRQGAHYSPERFHRSSS
ncbi:hypothetical protein P7C70_g4650, partial [Phenoliferia sp. Uapishka_3]